MDMRKLLLSALLLAVILGNLATTTSGTSSHHGHHRKHSRRPPPPPQPAPPPPVAPSGPPAPCAFTFGPWPATVPAGSVSFNDGAHLNFSSLTIIFTLDGVNGLLVEYVDPGPTFFRAQHGAGSGALNSTFLFNVTAPENNLVFTQLGGTYTSAGLDSINFLDNNNNIYIWGAATPFDPLDPSQTAFQSPPNVGYVIGLFGAANATALTQIGVCVTGA
eukprot:TRINITY_DN9278_c0_g1_i1.p1 TRINITY_DN9278_c0_g1~~TRINITY_DN9278_c0_g1_i1.p1  ORF type:complete len:237 (+),score=26.04 TRINITY_DN9278_c0_g1_i1:58-711(+)